MATKKATPTKQSATRNEPDHSAALKEYESALKLMQEKKYDRAKSAFEKLLSGTVPNFVADRSRVHRSACLKQLEQSAPNPRSPEERYDYSVALMNEGEFDQARLELEKLLKSSPDADFGHYGMAVLSCIAARSDEALRHLQRAIELNPQNRIHARNDSDFQTMADDPRFTELLYPETLGDTASPQWRR